MSTSTTTMADRLRKEGGRIAVPSPQYNKKARGWTALLAWILLLWVFAFVVAPWLQQHSASIQTLSKYIDESGIDAGAIYYTEVDEVGEADLMIRDTFRFHLPYQENEEP